MAPKIASSAARGVLAVAMLGALLLTAGPVQSADHTTSAQTAQGLFDEGRTLMKEGRFAEACAKLEASQALDPGGGTLLNLGICRQREGRTATAYRVLGAALAQARTDGRADRIATAERHLVELTPGLSRLTIALPAAGLPDDVTIAVDGAQLERELIAQPVPLDPGQHELTATQPGHHDFSSVFLLGPDADLMRVEVPPLALLTPAKAPAPLPPAALALPPPAGPPPAGAATVGAPPSSADKHLRTTGYALLGGGAAALAVGTYFGAQAVSLKAESDKYFNGTHCTQPSCVEDFHSAQTAALASDIAFGVGVVAVGAGLYVLFKPSGAQKPAHALAIAVDAGPLAAFARATASF